ncbi:MAG: hypothetical protein RIT27_1860 [Pseudomonadota bacterium]|jgi:hypothetical protein
MKRIGFILSGCLMLLSCAEKPAKVDYEGCGARTLFWAIGPKTDQKYVDVCFVDLDIGDLRDKFDLVPIAGTNQDTRQPVDNNRDGISGNGRLINSSQIHWGGNACQTFARRVVQHNCAKLTNTSKTGGCEWIALQIVPKRGAKQGYVTLTPIARLRLADGQEYDNYLRTFTTGFSGCR